MINADKLGNTFRYVFVDEYLFAMVCHFFCITCSVFLPLTVLRILWPIVVLIWLAVLLFWPVTIPYIHFLLLYLLNNLI